MDFRAIVDEVLAGYFRHYPVQATEIGHHAYDGEWPDLTDAGRAARLAWVTDASAQVEAASPDAPEPRRRHRPADPAREPGRHPLRRRDAG